MPALCPTGLLLWVQGVAENNNPAPILDKLHLAHQQQPTKAAPAMIVS
jgi:hypothetical protein